MKIKLLTLLFLALLVSIILITRFGFSVFAAGPVSQNQITIVGDSLMVRATPYLQDALPNAVIDGEVSRPWADGLTKLDELKTSGKLYPTIVFALGTNNSSLSSGDIDSLLSKAQGSKIVLVTVYNSAHPDWADNVNNAIKAAASAHSDVVKIADWQAVAAANPGLIDNSDGLGVHPTIPEGSQKLADTISSAISDSSTAPGGISQTVKSNCVITKIGTPASSSPQLPATCPSTNAPVDGLTNPFPGGWEPSRLDMGYDGTFQGQIVAPFAGTITYAANSFSNWGGYIEIKADQKPAALPYATLYFAEGASPIVSAGEHVNAGQPFANPMVNHFNGITGNIEWGVAVDGAVGTPTDPYAEAGASNPKQMVLDFTTWAEQVLHVAPPSSTDNAGYP